MNNLHELFKVDNEDDDSSSLTVELVHVSSCSKGSRWVNSFAYLPTTLKYLFWRKVDEDGLLGQKEGLGDRLGGTRCLRRGNGRVNSFYQTLGSLNDVNLRVSSSHKH